MYSHISCFIQIHISLCQEFCQTSLLCLFDESSNFMLFKILYSQGLGMDICLYGLETKANVKGHHTREGTFYDALMISI